MVVDDWRHAPAALHQKQKRPYPTAGWVGPQGQSGRLRKISSPPGFVPRTVQPLDSRYTDWDIPARQYVFHININ